ncbi:transglutaminase-like superfamily protein [mine drainage metagenome]|uniref:Transglutaminase-like superfamily protein n=1 Tax=mine drainage metagenome TaxID=410659 RepID=A0A1J5RSM4_9ZZZZ
MRVAINHETVFRYPSPANYAIQYLRLTPASGPHQRVLSWTVSAPGNLRPWTDGFGNLSHVLVVDEPHSEIRVTAIGEVEIADGGQPLLPAFEDLPPDIFLRSTRLTTADERIRAFAEGFRPGIAANARRGLDGLLAGIQESVLYRSGIARVPPSARQTLDARSGQHQDHAHLFITCCRSLGLPARYVSGYLCAQSADDRRRPVSADRMSSHAWAETWVEGAGWLSYDSASGATNAQAHIRVAVGLDALDAAPARGLRNGGEDPQMEVTVDDAVRLRQAQRDQQQQ